MTYDDYFAALKAIPYAGLRDATDADLARVCPHLTPEQAVATFRGKESSYVACPPLRVATAFQIVSMYKGTLSWSYAGRTNGGHEYAHMHEAVAYSQQHWPEKLIEDTWKCVLTVEVQNPSQLRPSYYTGGQHPTHKYSLMCALTRDLNDVINDRSRLESEIYDDFIVEMTTAPCIAHELKGPRGDYIHFNCAFCASGLGLSDCSGCGYQFTDDQLRSGHNTPLSKKMVAFLQNQGHVFQRNPELAWAEEVERRQRNLREQAEYEARREREEAEYQARLARKEGVYEGN